MFAGRFGVVPRGVCLVWACACGMLVVGVGVGGCGHSSSGQAPSPGQSKGYPAPKGPTAQAPKPVAPAPVQPPPAPPPAAPPPPRVAAPVQPPPPPQPVPRPMPLTVQGPQFSVRGVDRNDVLNVRSEPGPKAPLVGTIPPDTKGVLTTGKTRRLGPSIWREVIYGELRGWVNERFLVEERD